MQRPKFFEDIKKARSRPAIPDQITIISAGRGGVPMSPMMSGKSSGLGGAPSDESDDSRYTGIGSDGIPQPLKRTGDVHEGEYVLDAETTRALDPQLVEAIVEKARDGTLNLNALRQVVGLPAKEGFATGGYNPGGDTLDKDKNIWRPTSTSGIFKSPLNTSSTGIVASPPFNPNPDLSMEAPQVVKPSIFKKPTVPYRGLFGDDPLGIQPITNTETSKYPSTKDRNLLGTANAAMPERQGILPTLTMPQATTMQFAPIQPITNTVTNSNTSGTLRAPKPPIVEPIAINPATSVQPTQPVSTTSNGPSSTPDKYKSAIDTSLRQLSDIANGKSQTLNNISDAAVRKYDTGAAVNQQVNNMNLAMGGENLPAGTANALAAQNASAIRAGRSELQGNLAANEQNQALNATQQVASVAAGQQSYEASQKQTERANTLENANTMLKSGNVNGAIAEFAKAGITVDPKTMTDATNYNKFTEGMDLLTKLQATPGMTAAGAWSALKSAGYSDIISQALSGVEPTWTGDPAADPRAKVSTGKQLTSDDAHWLVDNGYDLSTGQRNSVSGFLSYFGNAKTESNSYNQIYNTITQSQSFKSKTLDEQKKILTVLDNLVYGEYLKMSIDPTTGNVSFDLTAPSPADTGKKFDGTDYNVGDVFVGGDGKLYKKGITTNTPVADISTVTAKDLSGQGQSDKAVQTLLYQMPENDINDLKANYGTYASSGKLLKIKDSTGAGGYVLATAIPGGEPGFKPMGTDTFQSQMTFQTIDGKKFSIAYPS